MGGRASRASDWKGACTIDLRLLSGGEGSCHSGQLKLGGESQSGVLRLGGILQADRLNSDEAK